MDQEQNVELVDAVAEGHDMKNAEAQSVAATDKVAQRCQIHTYQTITFFLTFVNETLALLWPNSTFMAGQNWNQKL